VSDDSLELQVAPKITLTVKRKESDAGVCYTANLEHADLPYRSLSFSVFNLTDARIHNAATQGYRDVWFANTCIDLSELHAALVAEFLGISMGAAVKGDAP
jgi:hypothetical protein